MARSWPLLLLVLAALLAMVIVFAGRSGDEDAVEEIERAAQEEYLPPELRGLSAAEREVIFAKQREAERQQAEREAAAREPETPPTPQVLLSGRVLDAESGEPVAGAGVWLEVHEGACPRMPLRHGPESDPWLDDVLRTSSGEDGTFALRATGTPPSTAQDLFVLAEGYVLHGECSVTLPGEMEIRLQKGLTVKGRVTNPDNRPVPEAVVRARPAPQTPPGPGHATPALSAPKTDESGDYELTGFIPGALLVEVDHPLHMPASVGPVEPGMDSVNIVLVPALTAYFAIRSDDGRVPEHPTVVWTTTEVPARTEVQLLPHSASVAQGGPDIENFGEVRGGPVRIPCDAPGVILQVRADGYATWISDPIRLPPEGGEQTFEVKLTGDLSTGRIRVSLEDDRAEKLSVLSANVKVAIGRLDPGAVASAYVLRQGEDLEITDLPAGRYRLTLLSTLFAPAILELTVDPAQETHELVRVRPPAKVRVKVRGSGETLVPFEIQGSGGHVDFVPEGSYEEHVDEATGETITVAGPGGLLASGLAAGTYTIVITSTEVYAGPTVVHLTEGETTDVEIEVRLR